MLLSVDRLNTQELRLSSGAETVPRVCSLGDLYVVLEVQGKYFVDID